MTIKRFLTVLAFLALAVLASAQTDPVTKPMRIRVSSGVADGLKTHDVTPKYPREARKKGIQGDVLLQATIDTKGNVVNLRVAQGDPILADAAVKAVKQWRYRPYVLNGDPVEVETTVRIQFHL